MILKNQTGRAAKKGYLVKAVRGGFDFAGVGDVPIGVLEGPIISTAFFRLDYWEIKTTGTVMVFVEKAVVPGDELRMPVSGEGGRVGTARYVGNAEKYTSIGRAIGKGKGLIEVALNIVAHVITTSAIPTSHLSLTEIGVNTHIQIDSHISDVTTNPHGVTISQVANMGSTEQIPYMNVAGDDFLYSASFTFNGSTLSVNNTISTDIITGLAGSEVVVSSVSLDNGAVDGTTLLAGSSSYGTLIDNDSITISGGGVKYLDFTTTGSLPVFYIRVDGEILGKFGDYEAALYYGNPSSSVRLQTTNAGITVTGIATVDGLAGSGGTITIEGVTISSGNLEINNSIHSAATTMYLSTNTGGTIYLRPNGSGGTTGQLTLSHSGISTFHGSGSYVNMDGILQVDTINERGSAGVTIESVLLWNGNVTTDTILDPGVNGINVDGVLLKNSIVIADRLSATGGSSSEVIHLDTTGVQTMIRFSNNASIKGYFGYSNSGDTGLAFFSAGGAVRALLDSSGNFGINTTTPTYKLDVNGTGRYTGIVVLNNELQLNSTDAIIRLGNGGNQGPHGFHFYDSDNTVGISQVYRTTPETLYWEDSAEADLMWLDKSGNLSSTGEITAWA